MLSSLLPLFIFRYCTPKQILTGMFNLVTMTDTVKIPPWMFNNSLSDAVKVELNKRFANKVIYDVGLCISLFDVLKYEDTFIFPGDGSSHTKVHFRFVVFRPFIDEVLIGKIKSCSRDGVTISLGFFDDILIPPEYLQQPSKFDDSEQVWVWEYETPEETYDLSMDISESIRFRIADEMFVDTIPQSKADESVNKENLAPYSLKAHVSEPGLGLLSWWTNR